MQKDDPLLPLGQLADALGLPYFKVQRAAARGLFPTYRLLNSRRYGRVSEVLNAMRAHAEPQDGSEEADRAGGGGHED